MSNGEIFKELKDAVSDDPTSLSPDIRDRLIMSGIIQLFEIVKETNGKIDSLPKTSTGNLRQIEEDHKILHGNGKEPGLIHDVSEIKKYIQDTKNIVEKAAWYILAPVLGVIGLGIVTAILLGVQVGK